jgi:protein required for attachment to host cells
MNTKCILVADGVRARFFAYDPTPVAPHRSRLTELSALAVPELADKPGTRFSGERSESHGHVHGHGFALDDHRAQHDLETEKKFAADVAHEAGQALSRLGVGALIVVADPRMLGMLRPALEKVLHAEQIEVQSLARELSKLSAMDLEEHLRHAGLLPEPLTHVAPRA